LEPGEFTVPLATYTDNRGRPETYHLPNSFLKPDEKLDEEMNSALSKVRTVYFKPYGWIPAIRLELPGSVANSPTRLAMALEGVESQLFTPAVLEPYPLFIADRMVKSLGAGVSVLEQAVSQHVVDKGIDIQTSIICLQQYRTASGRGGTS
jgi:hypothetical protein